MDNRLLLQSNRMMMTRHNLQIIMIREDLDPQFLSLTGGGGVAMLQLDFHPV